MWDIICSNNLNLALIALGFLATTTAITGVLWVPANKLRDAIEKRVNKWAGK